MGEISISLFLAVPALRLLHSAHVNEFPINFILRPGPGYPGNVTLVNVYNIWRDILDVIVNCIYSIEMLHLKQAIAQWGGEI